MNIKNFFKGIIFGVANIIPGVSGGTMAVVLGIFDDLLKSINSLRTDFKESMKFLLPILLGAGFGILVFASVISFGLTNYSFPTCMLFAGLVTGSIPFIYKKATEKGVNKSNYIYTLIAFAIVAFMSYGKESTAAEYISTFTLSTYLYLFVCAIIASSAMVVPGISGSFVMILLGIYPILINGIESFKTFLLDFNNTEALFYSLKVLIPVGIGIIVGVILISKIIVLLLDKAYTQTYFSILGLILGSIYGLFVDPLTYQSGTSLPIIIVGVVTFAVGLIIATKLSEN